MPPRPESGNDERFVRYLLRVLRHEDAERLDELSIVDEQVAWRLRALEDDLIDAYVGGTLAATCAARFESVYLTSAQGRQKVRFARNLLDRTNKDIAN
jgi:hypothetical protein